MTLSLTLANNIIGLRERERVVYSIYTRNMSIKCDHHKQECKKKAK